MSITGAGDENDSVRSSCCAAAVAAEFIDEDLMTSRLTINTRRLTCDSLERMVSQRNSFVYSIFAKAYLQLQYCVNLQSGTKMKSINGM